MKIRMILATTDKEYANRFAGGLTKFIDQIDLSLCTNMEKLSGMVQHEQFDICLAEEEALKHFDSEQVKLTVLLWDSHAESTGEGRSLPKVRKYQRISSTASQVIRLFAEIAEDKGGIGNSAEITVVWSPSGGCGKTMVAAAYAARAAKNGKNVTYLNLEHFASTKSLFPQEAISLSAAFEQMASNMALQLLSMRATDPATGIGYFGAPDNYDDINVFTEEYCLKIVDGAAEHSDEVVVDLSSVCDSRTRALFERATRILLVTDQSKFAEVKLNQFISQSNVFIKYKSKMTLIANKGAVVDPVEGLTPLRLPYFDSHSTAVIYNKLSEYFL